MWLWQGDDVLLQLGPLLFRLWGPADTAPEFCGTIHQRVSPKSNKSSGDISWSEPYNALESRALKALSAQSPKGLGIEVELADLADQLRGRKPIRGLSSRRAHGPGPVLVTEV